jgi:hypothetical protein
MLVPRNVFSSYQAWLIHSSVGASAFYSLIAGQNDQIRFVILRLSLPGNQRIITPRDLKLSEDKKWTTYLKKQVHILQEKRLINTGLHRGMAIGGEKKP